MASTAPQARALLCGGHKLIATATVPSRPLSWGVDLPGITITGHRANPATAALVEPTNLRSNPLIERRPTTWRSAGPLSWASTSAARPTATRR